MSGLSDSDYQRLLEFRDGLRRFLRFSEDQATAVGLTPAQHQLLLAIRGHRGTEGPTIGDVVDHLLSRHHSVVGLVDRAEAAGLVRRRSDPEDGRVVRLAVTRLGERRLEELTALHLEELRRLTPRLRALWTDVESEVP
jgi:DNA-binding MarR family transcriptional regulator